VTVSPERRNPALRAGAIAVLALTLAGCGALPRNPAPTGADTEHAIPGFEEVRAWGARPSAAMERDLAESFAQESRADFPAATDGSVRYAHLALSGGGANGAFGAGFLNGWSATGKRPVFKIVTGVSTGALMAPFAFLGPDYDDELKKFYTQTATRDVARLRSLLPQLLAGEALADTGPLVALIERHVDAKLLADVAAAHHRGRRLYVGTADLDAQQFVVWNLGKIAASGQPGALDLFRKVMLASAAIPIAFPPVFFEVEVNGARYDEMHVDGGVGARLFLTGGVFRTAIIRERGGLGVGREDYFVIHNGQLGPVPEQTQRTLGSIARRTLESAGKSAVVGDLFRVYAVARREEAGYHWVTIPNGVEIEGAEFFDPARMGELYDVGYRLAREGPRWETQPPGLRYQEAR
jgi:hypothetical protein